MSDNPFDDLGLDPLASPDELTERMRELVEDATTAAQKQALQDAWQDLTMNPRKRVRLALSTFVDSEPFLPSPPPRPRPPAAASPEPQTPAELCVPITDLHALLVRERLSSHEPTSYVPLASDPLLKESRPQ